MARVPLFFALSLALSLAPQWASARLNWPLPEDSLSRNGTPQRFESHTRLPGQNLVLPPLPDRGLRPKAAAGLKRPYSGIPTDVLRYHNDKYPTGWNPNETDLTPASVGSSSFGQLTTLNVDGTVLAQPLMVSNVTMPDKTVHNVLVVATNHNSVYAFDAQDYSVLWHANFGPAASSQDVGCGDVVPEYGIGSTPVIVRDGADATLYLVAATEPAPFSFHTKIHALDLATGKDLIKAQEIAPRTHVSGGGNIHLDPQNQWNRAALAYNNGSIYVGIGSHCDHNGKNISGWLLRFDSSTLELTGKFNTIGAYAQYELASVWMSGYSPAIDPNGNVYAVTGNGNYNLGKGAKGYGESVIALSPDLAKKPLGTFTPSNWQDLNNNDTDFGSGGAMLIPEVLGQKAPPMLVAMGKAGTLYLLDAGHLKGLEGSNGYMPLQKITMSGCWCGGAYYGSPGGGIVYYQGAGGPLTALRVHAGRKPYLQQIATSSDVGASGGSFPVVSSNGSDDSTAVVWAIERGNPTEQLKAYRALTLGAPLFAANAGTWSNGSRAYLTPLIANGRVYVPAYKTVTVFGLTE